MREDAAALFRDEINGGFYRNSLTPEACLCRRVGEVVTYRQVIASADVKPEILPWRGSFSAKPMRFQRLRKLLFEDEIEPFPSSL